MPTLDELVEKATQDQAEKTREAVLVIREALNKQADGHDLPAAFAKKFLEARGLVPLTPGQTQGFVEILLRQRLADQLEATNANEVDRMNALGQEQKTLTERVLAIKRQIASMLGVRRNRMREASEYRQLLPLNPLLASNDFELAARSLAPMFEPNDQSKFYLPQAAPANHHAPLAESQQEQYIPGGG
jgi:hypothetical protein